jgi:hypothetical protein
MENNNSMGTPMNQLKQKENFQPNDITYNPNEFVPNQNNFPETQLPLQQIPISYRPNENKINYKQNDTSNKSEKKELNNPTKLFKFYIKEIILTTLLFSILAHKKTTKFTLRHIPGMLYFESIIPSLLFRGTTLSILLLLLKNYM